MPLGITSVTLCENCPKAPPVPYFPPIPGDKSRRGTGGKRICGECLDLIGKERCQKPAKIPVRLSPPNEIAIPILSGEHGRIKPCSVNAAS